MKILTVIKNLQTAQKQQKQNNHKKSLNKMDRFSAELAEVRSKFPNHQVIPGAQLRMEALVEDSKDSLKFVISDQGAGDFGVPGNASSEIRLNRNNSFRAYRMAIAIYERDSAELENSKPLIYAPIPQYFTVGTNFNPSDLEHLYNRGRLSLKVGTVQYLTGNYPVQKHRFAGQTQKVQTVGTTNEGTPVVTTTTTTALDQTPPNAGLHLISPINFVGNRQTELTIDCPVTSTIKWAQDATNKQVVVALIFDGYEIFDTQNN